MFEGKEPWHLSKDGGILYVRLTPKSAIEVINGVYIDGEGKCWLKVCVNAVPEDGKANKKLIAFLAKTLGLSKSNFMLISGHTNRFKTLRFICSVLEYDSIERRLRELIA